jgi:hypothetical protein
MTMKNFLLPALAVVGIALTSAKTKADDGFGVRAEPDYYGSYYYPDYSYGPDGYYYYHQRSDYFPPYRYYRHYFYGGWHRWHRHQHWPANDY